MMIESPRIAEVTAPRFHRLILAVLKDRFGPVDDDIAAALAPFIYDDQLQELNVLAARCADLASFREGLKQIPTNDTP